MRQRRPPPSVMPVPGPPRTAQAGSGNRWVRRWCRRALKVAAVQPLPRPWRVFQPPLQVFTA